jgi:hypothetical protein
MRLVRKLVTVKIVHGRRNLLRVSQAPDPGYGLKLYKKGAL